MTIPIKISALNGTRVVPVNASNEQVAYPTEPTKLAVLRYIPQTDDIWVATTNEVFVQGDVYTAEEMKQYTKFTVECTIEEVAYVNIYAKKQSDSIWLQVGKKVDTTGVLYFAILNSDFTVGDDLDIRVEDYTNSAIFYETTSHVYATITVNEPEIADVIALDTNFECSGKANCSTVDIIGVSSVGDETVIASNLAVVAGLFEKTDCQLPSTDFNVAEAVTIRIRDHNDTGNYKSVAVVTKSGETAKLAMDAVCVASPVADVGETAGTMGMNATCTASTPTDV